MRQGLLRSFLTAIFGHFWRRRGVEIRRERPSERMAKWAVSGAVGRISQKKWVVTVIIG
jgi:predicted exporter